MDKLITAGFTINLVKCSFCKEEVKFLEHVPSRTELKADPQSIEAIFNYPAPRNQKELKKFLGTLESTLAMISLLNQLRSNFCIHENPYYKI
jgi:hypothetical protein